MNNVGKSGAIVTIVGSAIMTLIGFLMLIGTSNIKTVAHRNNTTLVLLSIVVLGFGIANIVLSALCLKSKKDSLRLVTGIIAIVSLLFAWIALFFPAIIILVGGILLLCGNNQNKINEVQASTVSNVSVSGIFSNKTTPGTDNLQSEQ